MPLFIQMDFHLCFDLKGPLPLTKKSCLAIYQSTVYNIYNKKIGRQTILIHSVHTYQSIIHAPCQNLMNCFKRSVSGKHETRRFSIGLFHVFCSHRSTNVTRVVPVLTRMWWIAWSDLVSVTQARYDSALPSKPVKQSSTWDGTWTMDIVLMLYQSCS